MTLTSSVDRLRPASPAPRLPERARLLVANNGGFVLLAVLLIIAAITSPRFFSEAAMRNTSRQAAVLGVVVIGQVLVMIVRCIDAARRGGSVTGSSTSCATRSAPSPSPGSPGSG